MKLKLILLACFIYTGLCGQVISISPTYTFPNQVISAVIKLAPGVMQAAKPPFDSLDVFLKQKDSIIYANSFDTTHIYPGASPYTDSLTTNFVIPSYVKPGWYEVHVLTYDALNNPIDNVLPFGFLVRLVGSCPVPFNISADSIPGDPTSEVVHWDPSLTADTFRIRFRESGTINYRYKDVDGALSPQSDTIFSLFPGALYDIDVSTICGGIHSTYSGPIDTFTTHPQNTSCTIPFSVSFAAITDTSVEVSWTDYVQADTFRIRYYGAGTTTFLYKDVSGLGLHKDTLWNLLPGSVYYVQISAKCIGFGNGYSFPRQFTTLPNSLPGIYSCIIPWNTDTLSVTNSTAVIRWTPDVNADTFRIRFSVFGSTNYRYKNSSGLAGNSATINELMPNTTYQYQVSSVCIGQGSGYSPSKLFTTDNAPVFCGKPYGLATANISNVSADLSWTNMITADSFLVRYAVNFTTNFVWKKIVGTSFGTTITGLTALTNYSWQVRSLCSGAPSPYSLPVTFGTPPKLAHPIDKDGEPEVFPNPASDYISIRFESTMEGSVHTQIIDLSGRNLIEANYPVYLGTNEQEIDIASLAAGVYFVEMRNKEINFIRQLVISR